MQRQIVFSSISFGWRERILFAFIAFAWIILGLVFGALILGLGAVAMLGLGARIWWLRRRLRRVSATHDVRVIDGRYVELEEHQERERGGSHV